ncbi:hypothetical protein [Nannocystis pusilla]|uniref:hypothetical protein n=1 Tax=Nannocystis pusilla TaxID=889268 RepID=UPI003DA46E30
MADVCSDEQKAKFKAAHTTATAYLDSALKAARTMPTGGAKSRPDKFAALAQQTFGNAVDTEAVKTHLQAMSAEIGALTSLRVNTEGTTRQNPVVCNPSKETYDCTKNFAGGEWTGLKRLFLCPSFFGLNTVQSALVVIHESVHIAGISQKDDVYFHSRLAHELPLISASTAASNPDTLTSFVYRLATGNKFQKTVLPEPIQDRFVGDFSDAQQAFLRQSLAWAEAKLDVTLTALNEIQTNDGGGQAGRLLRSSDLSAKLGIDFESISGLTEAGQAALTSAIERLEAAYIALSSRVQFRRPPASPPPAEGALSTAGIPVAWRGSAFMIDPDYIQGSSAFNFASVLADAVLRGEHRWDEEISPMAQLLELMMGTDTKGRDLLPRR